MEIMLTTSNIMFFIGIISTIFGVYHYFHNPQVKQEKEDIKLNDRMFDVEKQIAEIKEKHLMGVEDNIKNLNITLNELQRTVVKLSTIIDERIPKTK